MRISISTASLWRWCVLSAVLAMPLQAKSAAEYGGKQVLATIKPLQLLVKAVGGNRVEVDVLLAPQQSPHNYQLRPSERRKLAEAAQIYWIGPALETFLARTATAIPAEKLQTLGKILLAEPGRKELDHEHGHDHASDPHLWLDYQQIIAMSADIEQGLSRLMPEHATEFTANRAQFLTALKRVDQQAVTELSAVRERGFVMSHAAYARLFEHYHLHAGMALSDAHGQVAGAKRWQQLEVYMRDKSPQCFLRDPSEQHAVEQTFLQRYPIAVVEADTMGIAILPTQNGFIEFYRGLTGRVAECLAGTK